MALGKEQEEEVEEKKSGPRPLSPTHPDHRISVYNRLREKGPIEFEVYKLEQLVSSETRQVSLSIIKIFQGAGTIHPKFNRIV